MTGEPTGTRPLNDYSEITIKGTKYKIHSIFEGEKSFQSLLENMYDDTSWCPFQSLLEDLIITKAAQQKNDQNHDCEEHEIAV